MTTFVLDTGALIALDRGGPPDLDGPLLCPRSGRGSGSHRCHRSGLEGWKPPGAAVASHQDVR